MRILPLALSLTALLALSACDLLGLGGFEAHDDTASTSPGQSVTIDVLANDDGDNLTIVSYDHTSEQGGQVETTWDDDGYARLVYTPAPGFTGTDHFTYWASDESPFEVEVPRTSEAEVTVTVE
ncbi:MAG TPA: Ig-like domain-containing protein [Glycomyces sp.]|nr:Ig-like domain-containing protein [Glycomyces sp.]